MPRRALFKLNRRSRGMNSCCPKNPTIIFLQNVDIALYLGNGGLINRFKQSNAEHAPLRAEN